MKALAHAIGNAPELISVDLSNNKIVGSGFTEILTRLRSSKTVISLNLSTDDVEYRNKVTDESIDALLSLF